MDGWKPHSFLNGADWDFIFGEVMKFFDIVQFGIVFLVTRVIVELSMNLGMLDENFDLLD